MLKLVRYAAALVFIAGALTVVRAQEDEKVTISANLVTVNVSVTDARGRYVQGLDGGQFEVFDDGVRQRIAHFSAGDAPFSTGAVDAALGQAALGEVARASGGASYSPQTENERELFGICTRIASELRQHYTVGFYPAGVSKAARPHKIRIRVITPGAAGRLRLSYREGYRPRERDEKY